MENKKELGELMIAISDIGGRIVASKTDREAIRKLVADAICHRRQAIVYNLARQFFGGFLADARLLVGGLGEGNVEWIGITSLSQLRTIVGGRFQILKQRWISAGFPIREHRGDTKFAGHINQHEWANLAAWLRTRGFKARLCEEGSDNLFEIGKL
ncbi:MAG: hypothetical protein IT291_03510 [Deltaproteobacteria bacterium]|nr:hypothetical protein [Deltaproteobacteria bacterium]